MKCLASRERSAASIIALLLTSLLLLGSCGERERSNPLDPLNPTTHGSPPGFRAVALDGSVELRCSALSLEGLQGYNLYRRTGETGAFELLSGSPFPSLLGSAIDTLLSNGITYYYRIVPVIRALGEGIASAPVAATPGPHFAVVAGSSSGTVTRLSADLRSSMWVDGGFYYPFSIAARGRRLWVTDLYEGVICLGADGTEIWRNDDFTLPVSVAVGPDSSSAVADFDAGTLTLLSPSGEIERVVSQALKTPASVSFGKDGSIWVADPGSSLVNKYSIDGTLLRSFSQCKEPRFLDARTDDGACWVIDQSTNEVIKLSPEAQEAFRISSLTGPGAIAADPRNGGCWVADLLKEEVVKISDYGRISTRIGKVGSAASIQVSGGDGTLWLADEKNSRIMVLSPGGEILLVASPTYSPTGITILERSN